jgi:hypothetical protein
VDDGVHVMMTGTSIAAGVAAGAVALLLEESPGLTPEAARMTLQMRANTDAQTGAVPNEKWGYGKLSMGAGTSGIIDTPMAGIGGLSLGVPYPNPLQTTTRMDFSLEKPSMVHVRVYDLQGREVRSLISGPLNGGSHFATWDGNDGQGRAVPSGRYYMTVSALPAGNEDAGVPEGTPAVLRQSRAVTILR